jgi:hypothetical protein
MNCAGGSERNIKTIRHCSGWLRQNQNSKQARNEQTQRYGRKPPKYIDKWWAWVVDNNIRIVNDVSLQSGQIDMCTSSSDQYDQTDKDIRPLEILSTKISRKRAEYIKTEKAAL